MQCFEPECNQTPLLSTSVWLLCRLPITFPCRCYHDKHRLAVVNLQKSIVVLYWDWSRMKEAQSVVDNMATSKRKRIFSEMKDAFKWDFTWDESQCLHLEDSFIYVGIMSL